MVLICECNHLRSNHESGKTKMMDGSVSNCMSKDCSCKAYHPNHETRQKVWKIRYRAMFWSGSIIIGVILAGVIGYYMIAWSVEATLDQYTIKQNYKFVEQMPNGTINNIHNAENNMSPKDEITMSAMFPMVMMLLIIGMFGSFTCYSTMFETKYRELMREEI